MTEGMPMRKKWFLFNDSTGGRGASGRKKIYEVTVNDTEVTFSWGMAEKDGRQVSKQRFKTSGWALQVAQNKVWEKLEKGYKVAQVV